jgi:hypothetical protein
MTNDLGNEKQNLRSPMTANAHERHKLLLFTFVYNSARVVINIIEAQIVEDA